VRIVIDVDVVLVNMDEHEWDAVIEVHLKGHFAPTRHAAAHWPPHDRATEDWLEAERELRQEKRLSGAS